MRFTKKLTRWGVGVALAGLVMATVPAEARNGRLANKLGFLFGNGPNQNLAERLDGLGEFSILLTALEQAELAETVATAEALTVFAPTDAAFVQLLDELDISAQDLLASPDLADILLYHVVAGRQTAGRLLFDTTVETLSGDQPVIVRFEDGAVLVNDSRVIRANVRAANGIIHVVDEVLLPPSENVEIDSLVDILAQDGRFGILLQAATTAGLVGALSGDAGEITVFAPTDDAFVALLGDLGISAEELLASPDLTSILLYHVVPGAQRAFPLLLSREVETLNGADVFVSFRAGSLVINDSEVTSPNLVAPNGIVHVIDRVLLP